MSDDRDQTKVTMRKAAGITSLVVGLPNFILAVILCFGGIALTVILGIIAYELYTGDQGGDSPLKALCIVLLLVIVIVGIIIAVIATILSFIFALAVGGQTLGGYYAFRGRRFGRAVTLTFLGTGVSFLFGLGTVIYGLFGDRWDAFQIILLVWGIYSIFASLVSLVCGIVMISAKSTFSKPEEKKKDKKGKGKKKGKKTSSKGKKKKKKEDDEEEEDW